MFCFRDNTVRFQISSWTLYRYYLHTASCNLLQCLYLRNNVLPLLYKLIESCYSSSLLHLYHNVLCAYMISFSLHIWQCEIQWSQKQTEKKIHYSIGLIRQICNHMIVNNWTILSLNDSLHWQRSNYFLFY